MSSEPGGGRGEGIVLVERAPKPGEYQALRRAVGWAEVEERSALKGLEGSLYAVCAVKEGRVVGCGRVVGDGGIYFYLQGVIVLPAHQGLGLGRLIMTALLYGFRNQSQQIALIADGRQKRGFAGLRALSSSARLTWRAYQVAFQTQIGIRLRLLPGRAPFSA